VLSGGFYEWQGASFEFGFYVLLICECMSCSCPKISECIWKYSEISWREGVRESGLSQKIRRETTLIRPVLVVRFFVWSRHPFFWYQSWFRSGSLSRTCECLDIMITEVSCLHLV